MTHTVTKCNGVDSGVGVRAGDSFVWPCEEARPGSWEMDVAEVAC